MRLKPFFRTESRQASLWQAAATWVGTPFRPNCASKGHAVGCVDLCHELLVEVGAMQRLDVPVYSLDHGHHSVRSEMLLFLLQHPTLAGRLSFVPQAADLLPGDLLAFKTGHADHHLALALQWEKGVHAHDRIGVHLFDRAEREFRDRHLYTLRILEEVE